MEESTQELGDEKRIESESLIIANRMPELLSTIDILRSRSPNKTREHTQTANNYYKKIK